MGGAGFAHDMTVVKKRVLEVLTRPMMTTEILGEVREYPPPCVRRALALLEERGIIQRKNQQFPWSVKT